MVSSIGSVPEIIPGISMKGEYYTFSGREFSHVIPAASVYLAWKRGDRARQHSSVARSQPARNEPFD